MEVSSHNLQTVVAPIAVQWHIMDGWKILKNLAHSSRWSDGLFIRTKQPKLLPPDTFAGLNIYEKCWGSSPRPSISPDPRGPHRGRGGSEGKGRGGGNEGQGRWAEEQGGKKEREGNGGSVVPQLIDCGTGCAYEHNRFVELSTRVQCIDCYTHMHVDK